MTRTFLQQLFESGQITIAADDADAAASDEICSQLNEIESMHRLESLGSAPPWDPAVGEWAATILFHACRLFAFREIGADETNRLLNVASPAAGTPSACYSADVVLRALPDVIRLSHTLSADDPLTLRLLDLARAWPLSSVGVPELGPVDVGGFIDDPSLRRVYAQRIVQRGDVSRLTHPAVIDDVRAMLGAYPSFAPAIARHLQSQGATVG